MQNFIFENPTKIIFGQGQIGRAGKEVARFGRTVLLVYGLESIKKSGVYDQVTASLREAGLTIVEFPGVKSNPVLSHTLNPSSWFLSKKRVVFAVSENVYLIILTC